MRLVDSKTIDWQPFSQHRPGSAMNKRLINGNAGRPDNYELSLVHMVGDYSTPRHRHNFDQLRYMVKGEFGYGSSREEVQQQGTVGYFPEGVYYQQRAIGDSITLLFQGGGPSGSGFLSYSQLEDGYKKLCGAGVFSNGVFTWSDDQGQKHNKDAYEAIWESVRGKDIEYTKPRYRAPIIADSAHYSWVDTNVGGVEARQVGTFSEREIEFGFLKLDEKAAYASHPRALYYILTGDGMIAGQAYRAGTTVAMDGDEDAVINVAVRTEIAYIILPKF